MPQQVWPTVTGGSPRSSWGRENFLIEEGTNVKWLVAVFKRKCGGRMDLQDNRRGVPREKKKDFSQVTPHLNMSRMNNQSIRSL